MSYRTLPLNSLAVNHRNDRHGEFENETAAIAWLFNNRSQHMMNLAKDIVDKGGVYEPPLVFPEDDKFLVFDGNRRVTCLKLLLDPKRAPTTDLQKRFIELREKWPGQFSENIQCQIESDRDRIDEILFRRHTGTQNGVGQSTWDDRMKSNFVNRTGKGGGFNVADEIEKRLKAAGLSPHRQIPRSTLNRLLSSEAFRNRLGFSVTKGRFDFTHDPHIALNALRRVADDLAHKRIVLGDIWDVDGKRAYLDELERKHVLPTAAHSIPKSDTGGSVKLPIFKATRSHKSRPLRRITLIPQSAFPLPWPGRLQKLRSIWDELQFRLILSEHSNAISILFRVLLELSVNNYISQENLAGIKQDAGVGRKIVLIGEDLFSKGKIDSNYLAVIRKLNQSDVIFSVNTLNMYVHSQQFSASPDHLVAIWDAAADLIVHCLNA